MPALRKVLNFSASSTDVPSGIKVKGNHFAFGLIDILFLLAEGHKFRFGEEPGERIGAVRSSESTPYWKSPMMGEGQRLAW
jgi:hypothetical protein